VGRVRGGEVLLLVPLMQAAWRRAPPDGDLTRIQTARKPCQFQTTSYTAAQINYGCWRHLNFPPSEGGAE
jgi:hypothetical protein